MIEFGIKYGCDILVQCGLQKFCYAFAVEARKDPIQPFNSRYGAAVLVKYINLWRRMIEGDLVSSPEILHMFWWCMEGVWSQWCKRCATKIDRAFIGNFVKLKNSKCFESYDLILTSDYIERWKSKNSKDLRALLLPQNDQQVMPNILYIQLLFSWD